MRTLAAIEQRIVELRDTSTEPTATAAELLQLGEEVLEHWVVAKGKEPTFEEREGFRLLALHRQGCKDDATFNACRESCRELVYHYNLVTTQPDDPNSKQWAKLAAMVAYHLYLFVSGKMEVAQLGDFCCSSKPLHANA